MRRALILGAVALALAAGTVAGVADASGAAAPEALGWWTRRPGAQPRGDGGFELASSLQGEESVAAVRATIDPDATGVRIVVDEVQGSSASGIAFHACRAASPWEPADAGAWDARPQADCEAGRADAVRAGPTRWAIDVTALVDAGALDVVVLPTATEAVPGLGASFGFTAAFTGAQVVVDLPSAAAPAPSRAPAGTGQRPAAPAPSRSPAVVVPGAGRAAPAAAPTTTAAPATDTGAETATGASTSPVTVPTPMFDLAGAEGSDRPWGRLLLLVPLSALAGVAAAAGRNLLRSGAAPAASR